MSNYIICTDSACDISEELLNLWNVPYLSLKFRFEDEENEYSNYDMPTKAFYDKMRNGGIAKTSAINFDEFSNFFKECLKSGNDVLYLAFSSGLSTTYNSAKLAAEELAEEFPEQKIMVIDSLSASAGQGLLLYLALEKQKGGADLDETADYIKSLIPKLCHWFTVDDLVYLKRGGRVSPTVAFVGSVLGIKPILHVDNEGHLINKTKVRGRKTALNTLADKFGELADNTNGDENVFICQADCLDDAQHLSEILNNRFGAKVRIITDIGPVIGAHAGPGTIAVFFIGKER